MNYLLNYGSLIIDKHYNKIQIYQIRGEKLNSVLVVDDEKEIVELIDFYLKNNEYNTYRAFDGKEALEIFERNR